jgi:hypothetical protein
MRKKFQVTRDLMNIYPVHVLPLSLRWGEVVDGVSKVIRGRRGEFKVGGDSKKRKETANDTASSHGVIGIGMRWVCGWGLKWMRAGVVEIREGFGEGRGDGPEWWKISQQYRVFMRCRWHRDGVGPWMRFEENASWGSGDRGQFLGGRRWAGKIKNEPTTPHFHVVLLVIEWDGSRDDVVG